MDESSGSGEVSMRKRIVKCIDLILIGVIIQIAGSCLLSAALELPFVSQQMREAYIHIENELITPRYYLYIGLLSPVLEELIFRGLILGLLMKIKKAPFIAVNAVAALLFGIYHGNIVQGTYAFIFGMLIGYIFKELGIVAAITVHIAVNVSAVILEPYFSVFDPPALLASLIGIGGFVLIYFIFSHCRRVSRKSRR